jgi:hypothetical protein
MTLVALAFLLALGAGIAALAGTEPLISVTGDVRMAGDEVATQAIVRVAK